MSTAPVLVYFLLLVLLALIVAGLLMYYFTQQDLRNLSARMAVLDTPKPASSRTSDTVRRERSAAFDRLVMLEAGLSSQPREELGPEDMEVFEAGRHTIKSCNAELQRMQDWLGTPYDLEWVEVKERLPQLTALYRKAVEASLQDGQGPA